MVYFLKWTDQPYVSRTMPRISYQLYLDRNKVTKSQKKVATPVNGHLYYWKRRSEVHPLAADACGFFYFFGKGTSMHPNIQRFVEQFEREAAARGIHRKVLGHAELAFLTEVWGPALSYDLDGLHAEFPFKDSKGGQRFADFVFVRHGLRLLIEVDGFTTHARDLSPGDFDDHLIRQNDLILLGWQLLRFSANLVQRHPELCIRQIKQAIGHWWTVHQAPIRMDEASNWPKRLQLLIELAQQHDDTLRPATLVAAFQVSHQTARKWLARFAEEGFFVPDTPAGQRRVTRYRLVYHEKPVTAPMRKKGKER